MKSLTKNVVAENAFIQTLHFLKYSFLFQRVACQLCPYSLANDAFCRLKMV